ncbi:hydantoinase/oxoprolinase family protein [[Clostridium] leptum]|uniref:Hydantoinase/oxoprolinase family protein n=1 Tax=[Clostridium] leptum TaxID=1535 RepID=A0A412AUX4_9FIRM|nr:hydantoinase/oxoprolinase family protein [[Clostridium] leptum]
MGYRIGVDVGGTFTDFSIYNTISRKLIHYKRSSTPDDPSCSIVTGLAEILEKENIQAADIEYLAHGTTVATNALIEKKGDTIGLITTYGFKDLMEIGDQKRPSLYDLLRPKPVSLIHPGARWEVHERILYDGSIRQPLQEQDVLDGIAHFKKMGIRSIAVCTLFSFLNPIHEQKIREIIRREYPEAYVSISSDLVHEFREYARMSTTVLNAYLGPIMKEYVENFRESIKGAGVSVSPFVTQSNGSIISIDETIDCPIRTAVSGPSAGVIGAARIGKQCGLNNLITFDMGGTSIDVSLIQDGKANVSFERMVEGYPARIPMIDIVTVGAGGGSLAYVDEGGALKVGPRSAGAKPGPACYCRGGEEPAVTDANLILGKLNPKRILGGRMSIDEKRSISVIKKVICQKTDLSIEDAAAGIITVVNSNMVRAIRAVSVERGYDPRQFTLVAFGGAGPLHACEVAEEIGIRQVLFPPSPGTLCSLGLLMADTQFDLSRSRLTIVNQKNLSIINKLLSDLALDGQRLLDTQKIPELHRCFRFGFDCRYEHQNYELTVEINKDELNESDLNDLKKAFGNAHEHAYGYQDKERPVQIVNYRLSAIGLSDKPQIGHIQECSVSVPKENEVRQVRFEKQCKYIETPVYLRDDLPSDCVLQGPAIIEQMDSTCVIPPGWIALSDQYGNFLVERKEKNEDA